MAWFAFFVTVALVAVLGIVVNLNRIGFERRLAGEMRGLLAVPPSADPLLDVPDLVPQLPPPVARYRQLAVAERAPVRTLRLHHGGTFRLSPTAKALPIQGTQLFTADPPGFVWTGRIRMFPGVWIDACDMTVAGKGSMRVLLDDTVPWPMRADPSSTRAQPCGSSLKCRGIPRPYSTPARSRGRQSTRTTLVQLCTLVIGRSPVSSSSGPMGYLCG